MLTMEAADPFAIWRRPNSREQVNVPFRTMSTTVRKPLGLMSSAGTGKLPAALLIRMPGRPHSASTVSKSSFTDCASRMSQVTASAFPPASSMAAIPWDRCWALLLATHTLAPRRANSTAIALPRPVPPPVTTAEQPVKLPAGRAEEPRTGGSGRGIQLISGAGAPCSDTVRRVSRRSGGRA